MMPCLIAALVHANSHAQWDYKSQSTVVRQAMHLPFLILLLQPIASYPPARTFKTIVTLGDGFSDTGILFSRSGQQFPPEPYYEGRFSNSFLWSEYVNHTMKAKLVNFAVAGAVSSIKIARGKGD